MAFYVLGAHHIVATMRTPYDSSTTVVLNVVAHELTGGQVSANLITNIEHMIFGGLIIYFLIKEPHGLARMWMTVKEKMRLWPFPH